MLLGGSHPTFVILSADACVMFVSRIWNGDADDDDVNVCICNNCIIILSI